MYLTDTIENMLSKKWENKKQIIIIEDMNAIINKEDHWTTKTLKRKRKLTMKCLMPSYIEKRKARETHIKSLMSRVGNTHIQNMKIRKTCYPRNGKTKNK